MTTEIEEGMIEEVRGLQVVAAEGNDPDRETDTQVCHCVIQMHRNIR
jgi:hypothetical protein